MKNILVLIAHPDDLELMAGGTILKVINQGSKVHVLTFSNGSWVNPQGTVERSIKEAKDEERIVAKFMGYTYENLDQPALSINFSDDNVIQVLKRIDKFKIDTIICPSLEDVNHDHSVVAEIAKAASRRVPNLLMGQINYYLANFFVPNFFVDITDYWELKVEALKLYEGQWNRAGNDWYEFLDATSRYYGKIIGVKRAEGFYSNKYLLF